jgi:hypothetical protein
MNKEGMRNRENMDNGNAFKEQGKMRGHGRMQDK